MADQVVFLHPNDNVATAIADLEIGQVLTIGDKRCTVRERIPFGHKVALCPIPKGGSILKYGEQIGLGASDIEEGFCVHIHNVESQRGRGDRQGEI